MIKKIISGGQTGADRGGLDAAITLGIPHGGFCPLGRRAEDGRIPSRYKMKETASVGYPLRTSMNVASANATIVFAWDSPGPGSLLTLRLAQTAKKPYLFVPVFDVAAATRATRVWLQAIKPVILNVAGSRESKALGTQERVEKILVAAIGGGS